MDTVYIDWLAKHSKAQPDKPAIVDAASGDRLTYAEFHQRVSRLVGVLRRNGVSKGDRVAVISATRLEVLEIEFAAWRCGAVFVPFNTRLSESEVEYLFHNSKPSVVFYESSHLGLIKGLKDSVEAAEWVEIGGAESGYQLQLNDAEPSPHVEPLCAQDAAQILYSSGTTGRPKGVVLSQQNLLFGYLNMIAAGSIGLDSVSLCYMPFFHIAGINGIANVTLFAGGTLVLMREFDPELALRVIDNQTLGITYFFGVPTIMEMLRMHPNVEETNFSSVRDCYVGGAAVSEDLMDWWIERGVPISQVFGMTETAVATSILKPEVAREKSGSMGRPGLFADYRIVSDNGSDVAPNEIGELLVKGPTVTPGYWENPKATQDAYTAGWLRTGDLASVDEDGFYYIRDRIKDMYISGGENVYPAEVESVLGAMTHVAEVAIVGVPDDRWGEVGCAFVCPGSGSGAISLESIQAHCQGELAKYKWPRYLILLEELPHNATGKVDKNALRQIYHHQQST